MSYHSAMFCGHSHSGSGVIIIPVCHVISQDHVSKMSCYFYEREPLMIITTIPSLASIGIAVVEI